MTKPSIHEYGGIEHTQEGPFPDCLLCRIESLEFEAQLLNRQADGWKRHAQTSDEEVARLRKTAGDPDYSPAYQDEYQRLWHHAAAERDQCRVALRNLCAALDGWTGGSSPWLEAFCAANEALNPVAIAPKGEA